MRNLRDRLVLLVKMYIDRRAHRGASDWGFRWIHWMSWLGRDDYEIEVRSRSSDERVVLKMRWGTSDLNSFEQVFCNNNYGLSKLARSTEILATYATQTSRGVPLILDLGANCGMSASFFRLSWPAARIVAVEPESANFLALRRNTQSLANIECVQAAVASAGGWVRIVNPDAESWAIQVELTDQPAEGSVRAVSIPELLRNAAELGCIPFICKIDIEGFESEVFGRDTSWIDAFPVIIVELHDWMLPGQATSRTFLQAIGLRDRDFVYIGENVFSIRNSRVRRTEPLNKNVIPEVSRDKIEGSTDLR